MARVAYRIRADPAPPPGGWRRFARERLGHGPAGDLGGDANGGGADAPTWLHCASVGEVMTALPLVRALDARAPGTLLVTTATPTGARTLADRAPAGVRHRYLPIDRPRAVARFLDAERPACAGIVETEIWPWLFALARARGVPITILSGRLSARTVEGAARALAPVYRRALDGVRVLARAEADAARFRGLAGDAARVETLGDLKDAGASDAPVPARPLPGPYALAASTHADEEARLARAWVDAAGTVDGASLLVIAPRHPSRGDEVHAALRAATPPGTGVARRSLGGTPGPGDPLYLADTLGELDAWYAHASAAFVGGSLAARGGHNLMEPARRGAPIVTGPHASNFAEALGALRAADAIVVAADARTAVAALRAGLAGDGDAARRGGRALEVARGREAGVLERYLAAFPADGS